MQVKLSPEAVNAVQLIVGALLPLLVAAVTKRWAASSVKAYVLAGFAAVTAVSAQLMSPEGFVMYDVLSGFVQTFIAAVAVHYGLLKPTGVTGTEGVVAEMTEDFGVGEQHEPDESGNRPARKRTARKTTRTTRKKARAS